MSSSKKRAKPGPSKDACRLATVVLEVLGGDRSPPEAAEVLGVSLPRYYQLEERAVQGLVQALEPRKRGRQASPERELDQVRQERDRLQGELKRVQALLRTTQRVVGVPAADTQRKAREKAAKAKQKRKPHKPKVRAKRAIARLQAQAQAHVDADADAEGGSPPAEAEATSAKGRESA